MSYLQAIAALNGRQNIGGVLDIKVARTADIISIPTPVNGVVYGNISFVSGRGWTTWIVTHETASFTAGEGDSDEGPLKSNSLPFVIPRDDATLRDMLTRAERDEFVILYKDGNGNQKLFGSLDNPVYFLYSQETGGAIASRNGYRCRFYADGPDNSFFYNGTVSMAPAGAAPALVVRGDGTVIAQLQPGEVLTLNSPFDQGAFDLSYTIT